jgi:hypothetical protein
VDNFVFNYQTTPTKTDELQMKNPEQIKKRKKKKRVFAASSYESIDKKERFHLCRFIFCCNPKRTTVSLD